MKKPLNIMIVAGEHSGDILAAGFIQVLQKKYPTATFSGIGGERMIKLGFKSLYPMSMLSVFGLFEVIKHLPSLLKVRKELLATIIDQAPDVFIGVDAPDFNLKLERMLHNAGIKTVHYVSPTVWAWREKRIKKLQGSLNALLCIFPFEEQYFADKNVPARYIGHPLADKYKNVKELSEARNLLGIPLDTPVLTLMPGSRLGEISRHTLVFLQAAKICAEQLANMKVIIPMADESGKSSLQKIISTNKIELDIEIHVGEPELPIAVADVVLVASGTATLEVMLLQRPMVVAYKVAPATAWVLKTFSLLKTAFVSMPNLIAKKEIVKEFLQEGVQPNTLAIELIELFTKQAKTDKMLAEFSRIKGSLTCDANLQAANVICDVLAEKVADNG